jgi:ribosomal-protein-alanine N-acetyltransferase
VKSPLISSRLVLRSFAPADAAELHAILADPASNTVGSGPFTAIGQTERWIRRRGDIEREHGLCWYAVLRAGTGELLGNCGMLPGRTGYDEPEIGYLIRADARGQGYAGEAADAVLAECRAAGLGRVWASIRPANVASRRIVASRGFRLDRVDRDERGELLFYVLDLG